MATRASVQKPFSYAHDQVHTRHMQKDEVEEFDDRLAPGLVEAGFIKEAKAELTRPEVPAEPMWDGLGDKELAAIVKARTGEVIVPGRMAHADLLALAQRAYGSKRVETKRPAVVDGLPGEADSRPARDGSKPKASEEPKPKSADDVKTEAVAAQARDVGSEAGEIANSSSKSPMADPHPEDRAFRGAARSPAQQAEAARVAQKPPHASKPAAQYRNQGNKPKG